MRRLVGVCYLATLHIDFHNAEATNQIGIDAIHSNAANCFVARHQFVVEVADISDVAFQVYQVDIRVLIDSNESLGLWTPADMGDISVRKSVGLVVGINALVSLVVLIETV